MNYSGKLGAISTGTNVGYCQILFTNSFLGRDRNILASWGALNFFDTGGYCCLL